MGFSCHRILYFIKIQKIGSKAVNSTFYVRLARHEILTDAIFQKKRAHHTERRVFYNEQTK